MAPPRAQTPEHPLWRVTHRTVLATTFLFMLAAVSVSAGLVVHTAWLHDLENGPFAIAFAVLSARTALSWCLWSSQRNTCRQSAISRQQDREGRKPADETVS